jgi:hypothetical protein
VTLKIESVVDGAVGGNEALSVALGLESLHFSLPSSNGEMRVFDPVVVAQSAGFVPLLALQNLQRGRVGRQSVGDDLIGNEALVLEQFLQ